MIGSFILASMLALGDVVIDDSPTRVQTELNIDFEPVGTLRPKAVGTVSSSRWTLDCAGTDREHADWRAMRGYVAPLGIARIRQQAGWARCEKDPGLYDFAWLDQCVFDAKKMGVDVWMELSYGNPAYPGGGGRQLMAGFPSSEEALKAWDRWVRTLAEHYKGTVNDFCIWNEPNGRRAGNTVEAATDFAIRTAEILRDVIPDAHIDAFALTFADPSWVEPFVKELKARGKLGLFNSIAYHHYKLNPDDGYEDVEKCREILRKYAPGLTLKEGEGGTQSEWCLNGALSKRHWTELTQAKYDLRRSLGDLSHGDDTEVFHLSDLEYRAVTHHWGLLRYGLLKTSGQADGYRVLKVKMAYYAIQNAVSVFNDDLVCLTPDTKSVIESDETDRPVVYDWKDIRSGTPVVLFWDASATPSNENKLLKGKVTIDGPAVKNPVWVDVLSGNAYAIPESCIKSSRGKTVYSVPVYDSPVFITSADILSLEQSWYVREGKNLN